jgi:hypothetical protein
VVGTTSVVARANEGAAHHPGGSRVVSPTACAEGDFRRVRFYSCLTSSHFVVSGGGAPFQYRIRRRSWNTVLWSAGET